MKIIKGETKFSMVDISSKEMHAIYDAFNYARYYFIKMKDENSDAVLAAATNQKVEAVPEIRKVLQEKIEFFFEQSKKIQSYAKK
jgi:hypothetical protein